MQETVEGLTPLSAEAFQRVLIESLGPERDCNFRFVNTPRIIDSSQAQISDWNMIGTLVDQNYRESDGIVVIHGTDTMDYFCAGLHAMFSGLHKRVVCTGSMKPLLAQGETDAPDNFRLAVTASLRQDLNGVLFAFDGKVFNPDSIFKYTTENPSAFHSVCPPVLSDIDGRLSHMFEGKAASGAYSFMPLTEHYIPFITFTPGNSDPYRQCRFEDRPAAIVLEGLGNGNIPETAKPFLKDAKDRNVPVFTISAAPMGQADTTYAAGSWVGAYGVTGLGFMPRAACLMTLQGLLTRNQGSFPGLASEMALVVDQFPKPQA